MTPPRSVLSLSSRQGVGVYGVEVGTLRSGMEVAVIMTVESIESIVRQALKTRQLTLDQESQIKSRLLEKTFTPRDLAALSHLTNAMVEGMISR